MIDEKTHMWYILSGRYGDLAWDMLEDMKGKKFSHKKASKHLAYIMNNWPNEEVCRTLRTWMKHSDLDTNKINTGPFRHGRNPPKFDNKWHLCYNIFLDS
jgi:hypothetical protein